MHEEVRLSSKYGEFKGYLFKPASGTTPIAHWIWIHGAAGSPLGNAVVEEFGKACQANNMSFAAIEVPGHDDSARHERLDDFIPVLHEWVSRLGFDTNEVPLMLAGHSTGGTKLLFALKEGLLPIATRALYLFAPTDHPGFFSRIAKLTPQKLFERTSSVDPDALVAKDILDAAEYWAISNGTMAHLVQPGGRTDVFPSRTGISGLEQEWTIPILYVVGDQDFAAVPDGRSVSRIVGESPSATSVLIPGAPHNFAGKENVLIDVAFGFTGRLLDLLLYKPSLLQKTQKPRSEEPRLLYNWYRSRFDSLDLRKLWDPTGGGLSRGRHIHPEWDAVALAQYATTIPGRLLFRDGDLGKCLVQPVDERRIVNINEDHWRPPPKHDPNSPFPPYARAADEYPWLQPGSYIEWDDIRKGGAIGIMSNKGRLDIEMNFLSRDTALGRHAHELAAGMWMIERTVRPQLLEKVHWIFDAQDLNQRLDRFESITRPFIKPAIALIERFVQNSRLPEFSGKPLSGLRIGVPSDDLTAAELIIPASSGLLPQR